MDSWYNLLCVALIQQVLSIKRFDHARLHRAHMIIEYALIEHSLLTSMDIPVEYANILSPNPLPITLALTAIFCGGLSKCGVVNTNSQPRDSFTLHNNNNQLHHTGLNTENVAGGKGRAWNNSQSLTIFHPISVFGWKKSDKFTVHFQWVSQQ